MFTVTRRWDAGDGRDTLGTAETVDDLHELLREAMPGVYSITGSARTVRLDLGAQVGQDRAFVAQLAQVAGGADPGDLPAAA